MNVRNRTARTVLAALAILLPGTARRFVLCRLLGHDIAPTAHVGRSFVDVDRLRMAEGAQIGSLTVIRGCEDVELGPEAAIGPLNFINAVRKDKPYFAGHKRHPAVIMGRSSLITSMHVVDACDRVTLADYAAIAGFGTQVLTHSVDVVRLRQTTKPVTVGHHTLIGTASVLLPGANVPECTIISAGSVVSALSTPEGYRLYSGVPTQVQRELDPGLRLFHRTVTDVL